MEFSIHAHLWVHYRLSYGLIYGLSYYHDHVLKGINTLSVEHQASSDSIEVLTLGLTHGNGSGVDFQASQYIPMDPDAAVAAGVQCVHSLKC